MTPSGSPASNGTIDRERRARVAVVEDDANGRLLARVILEDLYDVVVYETGAEALEGIARAGADLVLLDVLLPDLDGTEVVRRIRADAALRGLPVIALTAHAMAGDREALLAAGFDDYVAKPLLDESVLLHAIEALLAARRRRS